MAITSRGRVGRTDTEGRASVRKDAMASRAVENLREPFIYRHCVLKRGFFRVGFWSMAPPYAFVTLLTSDSYLPGALTLAAALHDIHPYPPVPPEVDFQSVCLVTPETVDISSIKLLRKAFDLVVGVEIIVEDNERGLQLLGEYPPYVAHISHHSFLCPYYT